MAIHATLGQIRDGIKALERIASVVTDDAQANYRLAKTLRQAAEAEKDAQTELGKLRRLWGEDILDEKGEVTGNRIKREFIDKWQLALERLMSTEVKVWGAPWTVEAIGAFKPSPLEIAVLLGWVIVDEKDEEGYVAPDFAAISDGLLPASLVAAMSNGGA